LADILPVKNVLKAGHDLSLLLVKFSLEYAIWSVQVNQDGLKLNGVVYADGLC
jgi:hypothetical protein